jgi:hypothetical protein
MLTTSHKRKKYQISVSFCLSFKSKLTVLTVVVVDDALVVLVVIVVVVLEMLVVVCERG